MKKLKVGIIGTGMALERLHYPAFKALADRYEITALCDIDIEKARQWAKKLNIGGDKVYNDYRRMISGEDLDVVDVMVPIEENYKVAAEVAKKLSGRRCGLICEKPLAPDMQQALAGRDLAREYGIPVMVAENYRYNQEIDMLRDLVRQKKTGDTYYFIQNRVINFPLDMIKNAFPAKEWRQHPDFPGGAFADTGIHDLAGLQHIFGAIERVHAFARPLDADFSPYSVINANLAFKNGITGQFTFFCAGGEMQRPLVGLRIFGTKGMIYLEERDCGTINLFFDDGRQEHIPYEAQKGYYNELINFHNALTGTEKISVTPETAYGDVRAVQAILRSIKENKVIHLDDMETGKTHHYYREQKTERQPSQIH